MVRARQTSLGLITPDEAEPRASLTAAAPSEALGGASDASAGAAELAAELSEMKKKLGMFMLGGDMSGGQAGTHAALTLSNAITNLSVGCWSQVAELAPLPSSSVQKWRQEVLWYTAPLEQIIVREPGYKTLADGERVEVMLDVLREDVRRDLPALLGTDDAQQVLFSRFVHVEWMYVKPSKEASLQWWRKVAVMKPEHTTLSPSWAAELRRMVCWAEHELVAIRSINDRCLERMENPADFLDALPKQAKALNLGEHTRRALEKDGSATGKNEPGYVERVFDTLARDGVPSDDKMAVLEAVATLEKAALVWARKVDDQKAANARRMIAAVRAAMPGLGQTPLETNKLANNRDVGSAVLEALSRVLESRIAIMAQMIEAVLDVGTSGDETSTKVRLTDREYLEWHAEVVREAAMWAPR